MDVNVNNRVGCGAFDATTAAAYLEGMLAEPDRDLYQSHLHGCDACRRQIDDLRAMSAPSPYALPPGEEPEPPASGAVRALRALRMRSVVARAALTVFALVAIGVAAVLLFLATRSQTRIQQPPADLKYAPARPIPAAPSGRGGANGGTIDLDEIDEDDFDDEDLGLPEPGYRPGVSPAYPVPPINSAPPAPAPQQQPQQPAPQPQTPQQPTSEERPARPAPLRRVSVETPRPAAPGPAFRRVGQKTFKRDAEGFYVDTAFRADAKLPVVEVKAGSKEYVALLDSVKDLAQYFRLSDRLVVVLGETVYRVVPHA